MVSTSILRSLSIPKRVFYLLLQCLSYRRAMVNKLWCYDVVQKWFKKKQDPPHGRCFTEPVIQRHVATWFLIYRGLIFASWLAIIVCAFFEFGSWKPWMMYEKWPIYLTNWGIMLGLIQAFIGLLLTTRRWKEQKKLDFDPQNITLGSIEKIFWFMFVIATNTAICVTITYWCCIYDTRIHNPDPLNMMQHACNSVLMLIDFCVTSIPFRLRNFWWCFTLVLLYIVFTLIYYLAGGLDRYGNHFIYKILDWKKPLPTILLCIAEALFVGVIHCVFCCLERAKYQVYMKIGGKQFDASQLPGRVKQDQVV
ncbi:protein rolling stone isoform X2 [Lasioglossum baleicum]|uniref:protein rolling stone isoform X2 n=1 Tax=Lasioglossum baleicum TaxID=434251 RepID=UPI003FCD177E